MSIKRNIVVSFLTIILLILQVFPVQAGDEGTKNQTIIIDSAKDSITFKVSIPTEEITIDAHQIENDIYALVNMPGYLNMDQVGAPQLPFLTEILAVPFDSEISVSVIPGAEKRRKISAPVLPAGSESVEWNFKNLDEGHFSDPVVTDVVKADPKYYQADSVFPGNLSQVTNDGILRSQRLISIALYPIQYDVAVSELIIYNSMTVTVTFSGLIIENLSADKVDDQAYEQFFKNNLLNYEQAKGWRQNNLNEVRKSITSSQTKWLPPDSSWRIEVQETGMYKLTFSQLQDAGVPIETVEVDTIKMFHQGLEIAIKVDPEIECIFFYAQAIESKYTKDNVYWLTYGGSTGLPMLRVDGAPTGDPVPTSFLTHEHFEQDHLYRSQVPGGDHFDRFMWGYVQRKPENLKTWNYSFALDNRFEGDLIIEISLIGYYQEIPVNPDHRAGISINGAQIADVTWDGFSAFLVGLDIPANLLLPGDNVLEITALPTGLEGDIFFIDWLALGYARNFSSQSGKLQFSYAMPGDWKFVLTEFPNSSVEIFDISDPSNPRWIDNVNTFGEGTAFTVEFSDDIAETKTYIAADESTYLSVQSIEEDNPSNLSSESNGADYLMISHRDFLDEAKRLQTHKTTAQGLRTELIDVQDIYDEFNYGIVDPNAIHDFIAYAYNYWIGPAPAYVLLIGDGHFDPKNNLGFGRTSFIPPYLANIDPTIAETAADNRYVSIVGDDALPDLMIGRLSVNTVPEANSIISKIIGYETNPPEGDWKRQILAVTDNLDPGAHYPLLSDGLLRDYFPTEPFEAKKVYWKWTHTDLNEARADIQTAFNEGKFLVNYIGHAYYSAWAAEDLFTTKDIIELQPQDKLPVILAMTCLEGWFISPRPYLDNHEAMGEVITRTEGKGAVASWSPSGWGSVYGHDALNRGFFKAVYQDGVGVLSSAINSGILNLWATGSNLDLLDTYMLFGDPAMQMSLSLTAVRDTYTVDEDDVLTVTAEEGVLINDINPDKLALTAILVDDVFAGSLNFDEDGSFVYTPDQDYYGSDSFSYKIFDGTSYSNTVSVQLFVNPVNDPPVADDQVVITFLNTPVEIELTATDDGGGGSSYLKGNTINIDLTFELVTNPEHGELSGNAPFLVYTPDDDYIGTDQFKFKVYDGEYYSNDAIVVIYVNPISLFLPLIRR